MALHGDREGNRPSARQPARRACAPLRLVEVHLRRRDRPTHCAGVGDGREVRVAETLVDAVCGLLRPGRRPPTNGGATHERIDLPTRAGRAAPRARALAPGRLWVSVRRREPSPSGSRHRPLQSREGATCLRPHADGGQEGDAVHVGSRSTSREGSAGSARPAARESRPPVQRAEGRTRGTLDRATGVLPIAWARRPRRSTPSGMRPRAPLHRRLGREHGQRLTRGRVRGVPTPAATPRAPAAGGGAGASWARSSRSRRPSPRSRSRAARLRPARAGEPPELRPHRHVHSPQVTARPTRPRRDRRSPAAKGPTSGRWPGTWRRRWAAAATFRRSRHAGGGFREGATVTLADLERLVYEGRGSEALLPVETALDGIPALALTDEEAFSLKQGRPVVLLPRQVKTLRERLQGDQRTVSATAGGRLVALCEMRAGRLNPVRVFNLDAGD